MSELQEIKLPEDGILQGFFGESVYLKSEVDKVLIEKDKEQNCIIGQIIEQKDKIINELIKALQSNGPKFVELDGDLINLNNITSLHTTMTWFNSGKCMELNGKKLKEIVRKSGLVIGR